LEAAHAVVDANPRVECGHDLACDSGIGVHDGVCSLESTSLAGVGGVETCTSTQAVRVPLRHSGAKLRKATRTVKTLTTALKVKSRAPRDGDTLKLECLPAQ